VTTKKKITIQSLCINTTEKIINEFSYHESSKDSEESFFIFSSQVENKQQSKNELELITYFKKNNKSLNCLNNYSSIKKQFINYNTNLCSSAPVEHLFSLASFVHSPSRSNLSDKMFEKLIFLKGNQDFIDKYNI
jgi:hypothetical protein